MCDTPTATDQAAALIKRCVQRYHQEYLSKQSLLWEGQSSRHQQLQ